MRDMKNYYSRLSASKQGQQSPMGIDIMNRSFESNLPFIEPKLAPLSSRPNLQKVVALIQTPTTPTEIEHCDEKSSMMHSRYDMRPEFLNTL